MESGDGVPHLLNQLESNHEAVRARVAAACAAGGRAASAVRLLAVTKTVEPEQALALAELGCLDLGENRVPELERKVAWFGTRLPRVRWHFIGHLQRNKARRVVQLADEIHAVDSARLLATLVRVAEDLGRRPGLYLQVKLTKQHQYGAGYFFKSGNRIVR